MPCDYRILQSLIKGQVLLVLFETVGRSRFSLPFKAYVLRLQSYAHTRRPYNTHIMVYCPPSYPLLP